MTLLRAAALVALVLVAAWPAGAREPQGDRAAHFVAPDEIDLVRLLPPPPAAGSAEAAADLDTVLALQRGRTPESIERARKDRKQTIFRFADLLGPSFAGKNLPATKALFDKLAEDEEAILATVKDIWRRPRPFRISAEVETCVKRPDSGSYPSSHAALGELYGLVLADMLPEKREAIMARAALYAQSRALCGVHFPSDIEAGRQAGRAIAAVLRTKPAFIDAFTRARVETRRALVDSD